MLSGPEYSVIFT